jgi:hypothetical protein
MILLNEKMIQFWQRSRTRLFFSLLIALLILIPLQTQSIAEVTTSQGTVSVMVRMAKLRLVANHWSTAVEDLPFGTELRLIGQSGAWTEVETAAGKHGFIQTAATSTRKIVLVAGPGVDKPAMGSTDVVLAGKGFNSDVEDLYQDQMPDLDMAFIDRWEHEVPSDAELESFLIDGGLLK